MLVPKWFSTKNTSFSTFLTNICKNVLKFESKPKDRKLPKPPVPNLEDTLKRYLEYVSVIANRDEFKRTRSYVEEFQNNEGCLVQNRLLRMANEENNWINRFWLKDMYLNNRVPLPINSNPGYVLPDRDFKNLDDMIEFAAWLVCGVYDYKRMIDDRCLPKDTATGKEGGQPLCMDQYWRLFTSYRHPVIPTDRQNTYTHLNLHNNEHIIVMSNNKAYLLHAVVGGERVHQKHIYNQLSEILQYSNKNGTISHDVGVLTSAHRDKAAIGMEKLLLHSENRDTLKLIETSSFILCLDKAVDSVQGPNGTFGTVEDQLTHRAGQMLHGCRADVNSCNRWYDKTMQFIVSPNGACGMNYEHSVAEGIVVINLVEHTLKYIDEHMHKKQFDMPANGLKPTELHWKIGKDVEAMIEDSKKEINKLIDNVDLLILLFDGYGRDYPKSKKISPDAFIQLTLQWTHFRCQGSLVSTYESASIRRFREGRVDNIRSATPEALEWVKLMEDLNASEVLKRQAFSKAVEKQTKVMLENITGYGIDNHMTALRDLSTDYDRPSSKIFDDPMYQQTFRFPLSTSQVSTGIPRSFLCYGAVVEDGYGCGYNPFANEILFTIASFKSCGKTSSSTFRETLKTTLHDMKEFLDR